MLVLKRLSPKILKTWTKYRHFRLHAGTFPTVCKRKKMPKITKNTTRTKIYEVVHYSLPKLHTGKSWYVDFKCWDPVDGVMKRKKYHLDYIKKVTERKKRAAELIANITERLRKGWNVWAEAETSREYSTLEYVLGLYRLYLDKMFSTNALRKKSYHSYTCFLGVFELWLKNRPLKVAYIYQIDKALLSDFLDYILFDRDASARTRNNYRAWLYALCQWCVEKAFMPVNVAADIKNLKEEPKRRDALTAEQLKQLHDYLERKGERFFLLACMMEYYCFIRPEELTNVRIADIRVKEQKVIVSGEWTKNRKDGAVGLNSEVIRMMVELEVFKYDSNYFLFGGRDFRPSPRKQTSRIFRDRFARLRKALKWKDSVQFYSLKDTGIRDLANAAGIVIARDQARHSDISTTNRYLKGDAMAVHEETKNFKGGL